MNYFIFFNRIDCRLSLMRSNCIYFFYKKISKYKKVQIQSKSKLESYRNDFNDKYIDDGYDAY